MQILASSWPKAPKGWRVRYHAVQSSVSVEDIKILTAWFGPNKQVMPISELERTCDFKFVNGTVPQKLMEDQTNISKEWRPFEIVFPNTTFISLEKEHKGEERVYTLRWDEKKEIWILDAVSLVAALSATARGEQGVRFATIH